MIRFLEIFSKVILVVSIPVFASVWIPSHKFFMAGFLSLSIPIIVILNVVILIGLIIIRSRWAIYSLCILIWSVWVLSSAFSFRNSEQVGQQSFSLVTYNVNKLYDSVDHSTVDRSVFVKWCKQEDFDVVAIQEMVEYRESPFSIPGYNKIFSGKVTDDGDQLGLFLFSKFPVVNHGVIEFGINSFNRVLWADVLFKEDTVRLINVHLKSYDFQRDSLLSNFTRLRDGLIGRSWHTELTRRFVKQTPYPIVLCGDFNETVYSYNYKRITSLLTDTFSLSGRGYDYTYTIVGVPYRIDYIFKSKSLMSNDFQVNYQILWSDHLPVSVRIGLPDRTEQILQ